MITGMRKKIILNSSKGVGLIEILVATLIIGIALFMVGTAFYAQYSFINQTREKAIATLAAQQEIEYIRGMPFNSILNLVLSPNSNPAFFTASGFQYLSNATGTLLITDTNNFKISGSNYTICKVSATVTWNSLIGKQFSQTLVTAVTQNGIDKQ